MSQFENRPDKPISVDMLIQRVCDGSITADEGERLERMLREDPEVRRMYVEYMTVNSALAWKYRTGDGWQPKRRELPDTDSRPVVARAKNWLLASSGLLAVAAGLVLVFMAWQAFSPDQQSVAETADKSKDTTNFVATLRDATGPVWNNDIVAVNVGARIREGDLKIESGEAEIVFDSGAKLLVAGPAELKLESPLAAKMLRGTLAAHMPPTAIGFELRTPTSRLIDQGTEFGVQVDDTGVTQVHVFRGQVDVLVDGIDGESVSDMLPLYDRQARRIKNAGDTGENIDFSTAPFGRLASRVVDPIEWPIAEGGNGHFYQVFVEKQPITWHEAARVAMNKHFRGLPGHLVTLASAEEDQFVINNLVKRVAPRGAWIGLTDVLRESHFHWVTGEPYEFTHWASWPDPQPDNFREADWHGGEDYGMYTHFMDQQPWAWNDLSVDSMHEKVSAYVVEFEPAVAALRNRSMALDPIHWPEDEGGNGHYYRVVLVLEPQDWATIRDLAENSELLGTEGQLVALETAEERSFVAEHILKVCGIPELMIGLSGSLEQDDLRWVTGEPVVGFEVERSHLPTDEVYGVFRWNPAGEWQTGWEISAMSSDILPAGWFGYLVEYPVIGEEMGPIPNAGQE